MSHSGLISTLQDRSKGLDKFKGFEQPLMLRIY